MSVRFALTVAGIVGALLTGGVADAAASMTAPSASATATSTSAIRVSWIDGNVDVGSFYLERSLKKTTGFKRIAIVAGSVRNYQDGGLVAGTT